MKVAIGSENEGKKEAVERAFKTLQDKLPTEPTDSFEFITVKVDSGVGKQPLTDDEGFRGAMTRANVAMQQGRKKVGYLDYAVGIEGSLSLILGKYWFHKTWAVVRSYDGLFGMGSGHSVRVPDAIFQLIKKNMELGEAIEELWSIPGARHNLGLIGIMTGGLIKRPEEDKAAVEMALSSILFVPIQLE